MHVSIIVIQILEIITHWLMYRYWWCNEILTSNTYPGKKCIFWFAHGWIYLTSKLWFFYGFCLLLIIGLQTHYCYTKHGKEQSLVLGMLETQNYQIWLNKHYEPGMPQHFPNFSPIQHFHGMSILSHHRIKSGNKLLKRFSYQLLIRCTFVSYRFNLLLQLLLVLEGFPHSPITIFAFHGIPEIKI